MVKVLGSMALAVLVATSVRAQPAPCAACAVLVLSPAQAGDAPERLDGLRLLLRVEASAPASEWADAFQSLRRRGGRVGFDVVGVPDSSSPLLTAGGDALVLEPGHGDPDTIALALQRAFVQARGASTATTLVLAGGPDVIDALNARGLDAYVDAYLTLGDGRDRDAGLRHPVWRATPLPSGGIARLENVNAILISGGNTRDDVHAWSVPEDPAMARRVMGAAAALQSWFPHELVPIGDGALTCAGTALPTFLNPRTLDRVAIVSGCQTSARIETAAATKDVDRIEIGGVQLARVRSEAGVAETTDVRGARALTVEEIVARHQAQAARQTSAIQSSIAAGTLTLTFEAPGFSAPITVTSRTTVFAGRDATDVLQEDVRVNGAAYRASGIPRLPIIEPERVAQLPLAIALSGAYRYRLAGRQTVDDRSCYVVAFTPGDGRRSGFAGRAWIDTATFAIVRLSAVQTGLSGPITASEQTDDYRPTDDGWWLLARSDVRQTYEGAGFRTPIHRLLIVDRQEVNPADYEVRRGEAYASGAIMLRDTPDGYRYLQRTGDATASPSTARVVGDRAARVRTVLFGVLRDPNISEPLPFAGLSYVDFDLFGTGTQFTGVLAGSYAQAAFSSPSLFGTRWRAGGRAFAIAVPYNDRLFDDGREQYDQNVRQRPAEASVWIVRPLGSRVSLRAGYAFSFTQYRAADTTSPAFLVPADQIVHAMRIGVDVERAGWQLSAWWAPARRSGWRAWGFDPGDRAHGATFQRYGADARRSMAWSPRLATRLEASWMSGRDLDRFSRYTFGTFDNPLRGYPSALVRYDRGAVARGAIAWAAGRSIRLDGFVDTALVHDPGFGRGYRSFTGVGSGLEMPAPFGLLVAAEWGHGFQGVGTTGRRGTNVLRLTAYKIF
ncbi:MAG TPA: hypothetical protein VFK20_00870 [Vicinamibacterales bacterium]|nr:hypothetical protein [Vicinamibacterales bacterium]